MEPYGLKPHLVTALTPVTLELNDFFVEVTLDPHLVTSVAVLYAQHLPVGSVPPPLRTSPLPAHLVFGRPQIDRYDKRESVNLIDAGPVASSVTVITGVPMSSAVLLDGRPVAFGDHLGKFPLNPGRLVVTDRLGNLLAMGHTQAGRNYRAGKEAYVKPLERFRRMGPTEQIQFELIFLEHDPESNELVVDRLKNKSWVSVNGSWHQADNDGKIVVELEPGTYTVAVADRNGVIYAYRDNVEPGDTFLGAFNFSQGYGYYGYYSGKAFAVLQSFIDVFDTLITDDTRELFRIKSFTREDGITQSAPTYTSKSPRPVFDQVTLNELAQWAFVKFTLYDEIFFASTQSQPYSGIEQDVITLSDTYEYYNTSKWAEEFVNLIDSNNRPGNWIVLDLFLYSEEAYATRTKTTVYDGGIVTDEWSSYRDYRRVEQITVSDEAFLKNLSRLVFDLVQMEDVRAQSLIGVTAYDLVGLATRVKQHASRKQALDDIYLRLAGAYRQVGFTRTDDVRTRDVTITTSELTESDLVGAHDRAVLQALGVPFSFVAYAGMMVFDQNQYLPVRSTIDDVELRQAGVLLRDHFYGPLNPADESEYGASEGTMSEHAHVVNASTKRFDEITLGDRMSLSRDMLLEDSVTLTESATIPDTSTYFSVVNLKATRMAPMLYRLEMRTVKERDDEPATMVYLTKAGQLMLVHADADGRWFGQPDVQLLSGLQNATMLDVAPGRDGELYISYQIGVTVYLYRYNTHTGVHSMGTHANAAESALASTYPDTPYGHVVLAYRRPNEARRLRWQVVQQHPKAVPFPMASGQVDFADDIRLDQFENSQGQLIMIGYNEARPADRTLFHRLGAVQHVAESIQEQAPLITVTGEPHVMEVTVEESWEEQLDAAEAMQLPRSPEPHHESQHEELTTGWGGVQREIVNLNLSEKLTEIPTVPGVMVEAHVEPVGLRESLNQTMTWRLTAVARVISHTVTENAISETITFPGGEYARRP